MMEMTVKKRRRFEFKDGEEGCVEWKELSGVGLSWKGHICVFNLI